MRWWQYCGCQDEFIKYVSDKKIDGVFSASPSELALVAEEFQHQYFASQLYHFKFTFGKHARELFIPKEQNRDTVSVVHRLQFDLMC